MRLKKGGSTPPIFARAAMPKGKTGCRIFQWARQAWGPKGCLYATQFEHMQPSPKETRAYSFPMSKAGTRLKKGVFTPPNFRTCSPAKGQSRAQDFLVSGQARSSKREALRPHFSHVQPAWRQTRVQHFPWTFNASFPGARPPCRLFRGRDSGVRRKIGKWKQDFVLFSLVLRS